MEAVIHPVVGRETVGADVLLRIRTVMENSRSAERGRNSRDKANRVRGRANRVRDREDVPAQAETVASSSPRRERARARDSNNNPPSNQNRMKRGVPRTRALPQRPRRQARDNRSRENLASHLSHHLRVQSRIQKLHPEKMPRSRRLYQQMIQAAASR